MYKYIKLYPKLLAQQLQCMFEYKTDFFLMLIFSFFTQLSGLLFIYLIFAKVPHIAGWSLWEILFMYGMIFFTEGVITFLFEGTWYLGGIINEGKLDQYLLRPVPIGMQILCLRVNPDGLGKIIVSLAIIGHSLTKAALMWTIGKIGMLILLIISASVIRVCLNFSANCICFWLKSSKTTLAYLIHCFSEFGKYPIIIFESVIQVVLLTLIPYAFISFYPALYIFEKEKPLWIALYSPATALIWTGITALILKCGLSVYESSGN